MNQIKQLLLFSFLCTGITVQAKDIFDVITDGHRRKVAKEITKEPSVIQSTNTIGDTPLHHIVKLMIAQKKSADRDERLLKKYNEIMAYLVLQGADIGARDSHGSGSTVFDIVSQYVAINKDWKFLNHLHGDHGWMRKIEEFERDNGRPGAGRVSEDPAMRERLDTAHRVADPERWRAESVARARQSSSSESNGSPQSPRDYEYGEVAAPQREKAHSFYVENVASAPHRGTNPPQVPPRHASGASGIQEDYDTLGPHAVEDQQNLYDHVVEPDQPPYADLDGTQIRHDDRRPAYGVGTPMRREQQAPRRVEQAPARPPKSSEHRRETLAAKKLKEAREAAQRAAKMRAAARKSSSSPSSSSGSN